MLRINLVSISIIYLQFIRLNSMEDQAVFLLLSSQTAQCFSSLTKFNELCALKAVSLRFLI